MEQEFEELFRNKMDQLDPDDELTDDEKDQDWETISKRLEKRKIRLVPVYVRYAAAILIGIFIGTAVIKNFNAEKQPAVNQNVSAIIKEIVPPVQTHDTIYKVQTIVKNIPSTMLSRPANTRSSISPKTNLVLNNANKKVADTMPTRIVEIKPAPAVNIIDDTVVHRPLVNTIANHRKTAVHLLDIENEDRQLIAMDTLQRTGNEFLSRVHNVLVRQNALTSSDNNNSYIIRQMLSGKSK